MLNKRIQYYWCNVGDSWDYCSRNSCPVQIPQGYEDCSGEFIGKTVWFEYLYYKGYWLAKGYKNKYAALWNPGNHADLFCPDEGYGWDVSESKDGNSVNIKTIRPGYRHLYFTGVKYWSKYEYDSKKKKRVWKTHTSNMASGMDVSSLHELFDFRIICNDCDSTNNCILLRTSDESKLYANHGSDLKMCKNCGSDDWFTWRVYSPNVTLSCSVASISSPTIITQSTVSIVFCLILYYLNWLVVHTYDSYFSVVDRNHIASK